MTHPRTAPIIREFMSERGCTMDDLTGLGRSRSLIALRRDLIRLLHGHGFGVNAIARAMRRSHTTVSHHLGHLSGPQPRWHLAA